MKGCDALQLLDMDASMHLSSDGSGKSKAAGEAGFGGGGGEECDQVGSRIGSDVFRIYQVVPEPHTTWCAAHGDACTGTHALAHTCARVCSLTRLLVGGWGRVGVDECRCWWVGVRVRVRVCVSLLI